MRDFAFLEMDFRDHIGGRLTSTGLGGLDIINGIHLCVRLAPEESISLWGPSKSQH